MSADVIEEYCGCCGQEIDGKSDYWCSDCVDHVRTTGAPWECTWLAQHGTDCPYQVDF